MNNYKFQGYVYEDLMPLNNMTFNQQMVANKNMNQNMTSNTPIQNTQPRLVSPQEGFMRGILFADLYQQYQNFRPATLVGKTEQERMYLEMSQLSFAAHELNLYLDNDPNDITMIRLFNDYRKMANEAKKNYESKFGPVCITSDSLEKTPWQWVSPFPWDEGGM